ncbi:hypothetical protein BD626DRAFT_579405 [Schizophyllum amplum]|uniref:F-box domain-containing protein n=1 Tax=Schizophyllum amplum TaxID=97359 RepID=A0A550BRK7_9AGAR|nr:hypothetical protein BD626DRAFT_579405 [Auriculariopsis ampla]
MHPSLAVPELLFSVFRESVLGQKDLGRLSLVCSAWSDIANIFLWRSLNSLVPLLRLLPDDAWSISPGYGRHIEFTLERKLVAEDWSAFHKHTGLVRHLRLTFHDVLIQDQQHMIQCLPATTTVLPHLRTLVIIQAPYYDPQFDRLLADFVCLLTPTISSLTLRNIALWNDTDWRLVISHCPRLTEVTLFDRPVPDLGVGTDDSPFYTTLFDALVTCDHLARVSMDVSIPYSDELLRSLAACPGLEKLSFGLEADEDGFEDDGLPLHPAAIPYPGFAALRDLTCTRGTASLIQSIITCGRKRAMSSIDLLVGINTDEELSGVLSTVHAHCDHQALDKFSLDALRDTEMWPDEYEVIVTLSKTMLASLAAFRSLSVVVLQGIYSISFDVADWEDIAGWWPELKEFHLDMNTVPRCPLSALAPFAYHCPLLTALTLPIDASVVPGIEDGSVRSGDGRKGTPAPSLTLAVGASRVAHVVETARYIKLLFPNITSLISDGQPFRKARQERRAWQEVMQIIRATAHHVAQTIG